MNLKEGRPVLPTSRTEVVDRLVFRAPTCRHQSVWEPGRMAERLAPAIFQTYGRQFLVRLLALAVLVSGVLSGMVTGMTSASYNSSGQSLPNGFTSGSVVVGAGLAGGDTLTASNLVPGDSFVSRLTVQSNGSLGLRYAMTASVTGDTGLASGLLLAIRTKTANPCSSQDGTVLYGPAAMNAAFLGDPAYGQQTGDRLLEAGVAEDLCFALVFPSGASSSLQGKSATVTFNFAAEQQ
jgi:hypothetical protein